MGDPLFIGEKEGGNPTSNRCGIPYFLKTTVSLFAKIDNIKLLNYIFANFQSGDFHVNKEHMTI